MKLALDVCCGKGGATQAFRQSQDWYVLGIDNNPKMRQFWMGKNVEFLEFDVTVLDWERLKEVLTNKGFDHVEFLWASPPCERFSIANRMFPKKGIQKALSIVGAVYEGIACLRPKFWIVENPKGRLRWFLGKPNSSIALSNYGGKYKKPTDLWHNVTLPLIDAEMPYEPSWSSTKNQGKGSTGLLRLRNPVERAMMPLGLSEAVKTAIEAQQP